MSTTRDEIFAHGFISGAEDGVIFEINVVNLANNMLHPFVDISKYSSCPHEKEVLFFAGAVFRIDSVEKMNDSKWLIKLTLSNETVDQIEQIINGVKEHLTSITCCDHLLMKVYDIRLFPRYYRMLTGRRFSFKDIMTNTFPINFFDLTAVLGDYRKTIEYYKELLLDENFIDHSKFIVLHIMIGYNYSYLLGYDRALLHYGIAFSSLDDSNLLTTELYILIGDVWREKDDSKTALSCYEKALELLLGRNIKNQNIATIYRKMSAIYLEQNNCKDAAIYEEKANLIDEHRRQRSEFDIELSLKYFQNQLRPPPTLISIFAPERSIFLKFSGKLYSELSTSQ